MLNLTRQRPFRRFLYTFSIYKLGDNLAFRQICFLSALREGITMKIVTIMKMVVIMEMRKI